MNIKTQIAQFQAAQEAAKTAHDRLLKRLDHAADVIRTIERKKQYKATSTRWIDVYRKSDAVIEFSDNEQYPITITHGTATYRVPAIFVYGSVWDIAKATRQTIFVERFTEWNKDLKRLEVRVKTADDRLAAQIAQIKKDADAKIREAERTHKQEVINDGPLLETRRRQVAKALAAEEKKAARKNKKQQQDQAA